MHPEVLILDEPASGLDPIGRKSIFDGLVRYRDNTGAAVVIVSHSMEDMAKYCDDVVVMANAKAIMQGQRREVFAHVDKLENMGLNIPQITGLMRMLSNRGIPVSSNVYTVQEAMDAVLALFSENRMGGDA